MTDIEHLKKRAEELEQGNERSYAELLQATRGQAVMDTGDFRRELFINQLVEWGVITEQQKLEFDIKFHEEVESKLNETWAQVREAQGRAKLSVVKKAPAKLLGPDGKAL